MLTFILGLLAIGLYALGATFQLLVYLRRKPANPALSLAIGTCALAAHLATSYQSVFSSSGIDLSLTNSLALSSALIVFSLLLLGLRKPVHNLSLITYPLAVGSILALLLISHEAHRYKPEYVGIYLHILLSILAYSVSAIAAAQGVLILLQNHNLKKRNSSILSRNLPPLLTMEKLLFEIVRLTAILLFLSVVSGAVFIEDFFAQKLAHKTAFTLLALIVFVVILGGRTRYGWRGTSVSSWTIAACGLLMTGYFGSKFVLEWVLQQPLPN